jgi:hypothetical protein
VTLPTTEDGTYTVTATVTDAAGNSTSDTTAAELSIDTVAPAEPTVDSQTTNDSTPTVTGTVTLAAGETLAVTINGVTYTTANGLTVTDGIWSVILPTTADGTYAVTATATDAAGNTTSDESTEELTIDTVAPAAPTVDSQTTNDSTPTVTGTVTLGAGETLAVTIDGTTYTTANGLTVTDGIWSVTLPTTEDGTYTVTATVTDAAGNSTSDTTTNELTIDTEAPTLTITVDDVTEDNILNATEAGESITITGTTAGAKEGDTVTLTINEKTFTGAVDADGNYSIEVPGADLAADLDTTIAASVSSTDPAGNTGTATDTQAYTVDTEAPAPTITVDDVTEDNILNATEAGESITITGTTEGALPGDTVTLTINEKTFTGAVDGAGNYSIEVPGADLAADLDTTIAASVSTIDEAGNTGTATDTQPYTVDTEAPTLTITVDDVTDDNILNATEAGESITITGTTAGAKEGDTVTLTINEKTFTGTVDAEGNYSIEVPGADLAADLDTTIAASVSSTDAAGNTGTATDTQPYTVDTEAPTLTITVDDVTEDNILNAAESGESITITGTTEGALPGDTVTLTINGKTFTGTVDADGNYSIEVPGADLAADLDTTIAASVSSTDAAGNTGTATDTQPYTVDTEAPAPTITVDDVTEDNILNAVEAGELITITGTTTGTKAGDTVTLTINGKTFTGTVDGAGNYSIEVPGADLAADLDTSIAAAVSTTDAAGNTGTGTGTKDYEVDTDGDGIPDSVDLDDDNDGIPDTVEIANALNGGDTDGDGIPDYLDLDSDNDGLFDVVEAGHGGLDANRDGRIDTPVGANGLANSVETSPESGLINYVPSDTDGDGRPDYLDLDSDNDSISDLLESGNAALVDLDHNGLVDGVRNANGLMPGSGASPVDSDGDGLPDYRDVDSNNDGVKDIVDNGFGYLDANGDGMIDDPADGDGDGIKDILDTMDDTFGGFPIAGCEAWNLANPADTDKDVFPADQEYVFGNSPTMGDHLVSGTTRRAGMELAQNATNGLNITVIRPQGRYDATYTVFASSGLGVWTALTTAPVVTSNGDGTDTLTWANIQTSAPLTADRGFVRLKVWTSCNPAGSYTLVQGWCRENVGGVRQTYGVNFTSLPVFTGRVDSASGSTLTLTTSASGKNLSTVLISPDSYYVELTNGSAEGQRIDIASGGVNTLSLNLASPNNTTSVLPSGLDGSNFVIRKHRTLGVVFSNAEWVADSTVGSSDQVLIWNGTGYNTYWNNDVTGTWVQQGAGLTSRDSTVIPPGVAVFVVHANTNGSNTMLQVGDVRYNDFVRPLVRGSTGLNFVANGYSLDATPAALGMTEGNGFISGSSVGSATQILNWNGDTTVNATGFATNFLLDLDGSWRSQGTLANTTNVGLFRHCRGTIVKVLADNLNWKHARPWNPQPWVQP